MASATSRRSPAGANSWSRLPDRHMVAVPPPTVIRNPSSAPPFVSRRRALKPMSWIAVNAWSSGQPSKAILNLRGGDEDSGCRKKYRVSASANGVTSKSSPLATPAYGQHVMLRTECFAHSDTDVGEELHRQLHIVQLHEMDLDVLARGDVAKAARIGLGHRREGVQLAQVEHSLRHLDPKHVDVTVLPLAIGPAHQAKLAPLVGADRPALKLLQRGDELVDVVLVGERETRATKSL